ncbi:uroporphyrinogen-III C-methyltransferase [Pseudoalteromonas sp. BDTF-M6]|uniref:uroporphyrinogen-III C-methyltransferase n=1 Tax=Pseudoalteromonas sp. BDTF-M6 TaxID=2796132 RepID=UPI001BAFD776|nr:uroporphyrinogen-III C-methyltransferase [Pseudoalteromonas sp. BDTF-M6]MBS3799335.1 uroporphyrinogen-III synthase [Pseudoalteromonas sp. BDTF-M6]
MAHIVVTRPQGKGQELADLLSAQGHKVTQCPVLNIEYLDSDEQELATLDEADIAVFVSQDAVSGLYQQRATLPSSLQCVAVGEATAEAIESHFQYRALVPEQHDSEGVLALPQLQQVEGKSIVLVKGRGGRTLIAKTLKQRGAFVNPLVVYQRSGAKPSSDAWLQQWQQKQVDALVITSNSSVDAIFASQDPQLLQWLKSRHFYIVSARTGAHLEQQGVATDHISIAAGVTNQAIAACIDSEQENKMSEQPEKPEQGSTPANTSAATTKEPQPKMPSDAAPTGQRRGMSKLGLLALFIALGAGAGTGYLYWQQYQQQSSAVEQENAALAQMQQRVQQLRSANQALTEQIKALGSAQQTQQQQSQQWQQDFNDDISRQLSANQRSLITHVEQSIAAAQDNTQPPLDMNELRRLVALADFKIWSENNYAGAASVLERADALLASYPGNAQLRRAIHSDLQTLASIELADVQAIVLTLHGLGQQVDKLAFNMVDLPDEPVAADNQALSDNVSDWRANLGRSWDKLVDDFIKVRKRETTIEPLLDNEQQRLIKQRLHFYLDQAGFAATHQYVDLYKQSLQGAADLITRYFDLSEPQTSQFLSQLKQLRLQQLTPAQPVNLATVSALEES